MTEQIHDVLARGNESSLQTYEKPIYSYEIGSWLIPQWGSPSFHHQTRPAPLRRPEKRLPFALLLARYSRQTVFPAVLLTPSEDESPEAILPLDAIARIVYDMPQNSIPAVMAHRSPQQMAKIPLISELWNRVQEVKSGKMAVFAVLVEEAARKVVVTVETDWHVGGNRGNLSVLAVGQLHGIGRFIRSEKLPICARKQPVSSAEHGGDSAAAE